MLHSIYKYPVRVTDINKVEMPKGAKVLSVQMQRGVPCIWALVDPAAEMETRMFFMFGTGHPVEYAEGLRFIGTFQLVDRELVFHLFEPVGRG